MPDTSIDTYLDRVDARLAELDDNGDRATYLNILIGLAEENRRRFEETLDPRYGNAFQIGQNLAGLYERLDRVRADIKTSIAEAEAVLEQTPYVADIVAVALARRHGFELPSAQIKQRVH